MTVGEYAYRQLEAKRYKASLALSGKKAVIYLEDKNDEPFWIRVLKQFKPDDSFYWVFGSRSTGSGCTQGLKYKDFLDKQFLIAIDSDFRYLLQEAGIDIAHYILQTYTYSFENHYCCGQNMEQALCMSCQDSNVGNLFSFSKFLKQYALIVYPLFISLLYCIRTRNNAYTKEDFVRVLDLPPKMNRSVVNNGRVLLSLLQQKVDIDLARLVSLLPNFSWKNEAKRYEPLGLNKETAYLYIRGHNLYSVLSSLGEEIVNLHIKQEKGKLPKSQHASIYQKHVSFKKTLLDHLSFGYLEMDKIENDINQVF